MRASSLQSNNLEAVNREIGSVYDDIIAVKAMLDEIAYVASADIEGLIAALEEAKDFTGITVVTGSEPSWDPVGKVLTVPVGPRGLAGPAGVNGLNGMVPILEFSIDGDGDLSYEVVGYEEGPAIGDRYVTEEW